MRRRRSSREEPSLVPLADMLTNIVGIMLFILAFAVLVAGGAVIVRRLPMETDEEGTPISFVCLSNKLVPINRNLLEEHLQITNLLCDYQFEANALAKRLDGAAAEDAYFRCKGTTEGVISGRTRSGRLVYVPKMTVEYSYKPDTGYSTNDLARVGSPLLALLATNQPKEKFVYFHVRPDALNTFWLARDLAVKEGFHSGWMPFTHSNLLFGTGGGMSAKSQ